MNRHPNLTIEDDRCRCRTRGCWLQTEKPPENRRMFGDRPTTSRMVSGSRRASVPAVLGRPRVDRRHPRRVPGPPPRRMPHGPAWRRFPPTAPRTDRDRHWLPCQRSRIAHPRPYPPRTRAAATPHDGTPSLYLRAGQTTYSAGPGVGSTIIALATLIPAAVGALTIVAPIAYGLHLIWPLWAPRSRSQFGWPGRCWRHGSRPRSSARRRATVTRPPRSYAGSRNRRAVRWIASGYQPGGFG